MLIHTVTPEPLMLMPPEAPLSYSCKGCGRENLRAEDMGKDRSKPNGLHSRCLLCKDTQRRGQRKVKVASAGPARPLDPAAAVRRDALMELVKRHRLEFEDICAFYRTKDHSVSPRKGWVSLAQAIN